MRSGLRAQKSAGGFDCTKMQDDVRPQENTGRFEGSKNAGRFEGSEECKNALGLRRMQEGLRAQRNVGKLEGTEKCGSG